MRAMHFWVVGGDLRQVKLAELLAEDGHTVHTYGLEKTGEARGTVLEAESLLGIRRADCVILPLPVAGEEGKVLAPLSDRVIPVEGVFAAMRPGQLALGGLIGPETAALGEEKGILLQDYFQREELAVANAVPTAEGALQLAMENLPITLHGCRALVLGYGRIGKILAHRLRGLGAFVTVAARKYEQLAWAEADGCTAQRLADLPGWLCGYDLVLNTIPSRVLTEGLLADLKPACLVIDVASRPGGVDMEAAGRLGVPVIWALSLPGKVAPVTAGRAIQQTVYHILQERGL